MNKLKLTKILVLLTSTLESLVVDTYEKNNYYDNQFSDIYDLIYELTREIEGEGNE